MRSSSARRCGPPRPSTAIPRASGPRSRCPRCSAWRGESRPTPLSVLVTGETGTGKEMLARAIHRASDRADRPMIPFNCTRGAPRHDREPVVRVPRGAFTGADASFAGVIRSAAGGTLFLDEIAEVPLDVQPKLLRFLETHEIHPLGETQPIKVDVRVIAATNARLEQLVAEGRFSEDLFYRLNVVQLKLPPLRERREEIPPLVEHYLRKYGDEQKKGRLTLSDETLEYLLLYSWPGNMRATRERGAPDGRDGRDGRHAHARAAVAGDPGVTPHDSRGRQRRRSGGSSPDRSAAPRRRRDARTDNGQERARSHARARRGSRAHARNLQEGAFPQATPLGHAASLGRPLNPTARFSLWASSRSDTCATNIGSPPACPETEAPSRRTSASRPKNEPRRCR